ncbi:MAG: TerB family tellurite resistance protein [Candidatus Electrothrix sp. YB6]
MAQRNWGRTGEQMVNSSADFIGGVGNAFKGIGNRFKRKKFEPFVEALCAVVGDVASQNGRLYREELEEFRKFLLQNCRDTPILEMFSIDELVKKMEHYAVSAFLCDEEAILLAVRNIEDPELARLVILCALAVAAADGDCDPQEQACIERHAQVIRVDVHSLAGEFNLSLNTGSAPKSAPKALPSSAPPPPRQTPSSPPSQPGPSPTGVPCPMCKGAGGNCVFCKGTGRK